MDCDFTEEVSLLVDGELPPHAAARLGTHIEGCAACRQARESFLLLRRELRAYDRAPDPNVQRAALSSILNAGTSPRGRVEKFRGSLAGLFGAGRLRPGHVAALALLLTITALGLLWLKGPRTSRQAPPAVADLNGLPVQTATKNVEKKSENSGDVQPQPSSVTKTPEPSRRAAPRPNPRRGREIARVRRDGYRSESQGRENLRHGLPREVALVGEPSPSFSPPSAFEVYAAADDPSLRIGRHAERVERLLRSFRNARLNRDDSTLEVAEARRLSKRLLYSNIALRREAESTGDLPAEGLLDSVEPILIDISNLPDAPSQEAVGSIKERINRRQLVGALQAQGMLVTR